MTGSVQQAGLYARLGGVEYEVIWKGGWALWSGKPAVGFDKRGSNGYIRPIAEGEQLEAYRVAHSGSYRGISVSISPSNQGRVMATTKDPRAREAGFDTLERDEWVKLIPADDSQLRFTTTRTPEPGPWMAKGGSGRRS